MQTAALGSGLPNTVVSAPIRIAALRQWNQLMVDFTVNRARGLRVSLLPAVVLAGLGCGSDGPAHSALPSLSVSSTWGCAACSGPEELDAVLALAVGPDGTPALLGRSAPFVRIFRKDSIIAWGVSGDGPGELKAPIAMTWTGRSRLRISDLTKNSLLEFSLEGELIDETASSTTELIPRPFSMVASPDASMAIASESTGPGGGPRITLIDSIRGNLEVRSVVVPAELMPPGRSALFVAHAVSQHGLVALGRGLQGYDIILLGLDGRAVASLRRDIPRRPRTDAEMAAVRSLIGHGPAGPSSTDRAIDPENPHFSMNGLRFDTLDRLWILTTHGEPGTSDFHVYDSELSLLGSITVDFPLSHFDIGGRSLAGYYLDELGIPNLIEWTIEEPVAKAPAM